MNIRNETLDADGFYHIYNRGINGCNVYICEENYRFFLKQFSKYLIEYVDVYAYCLMPNHFHFLIKIKTEIKTIVKVPNFDNGKLIDKKNLAIEKGLHSTDSIVSKQIGKFISSYTQAFNKVNVRSGALFESPFKRKRIDNYDYLKNLILYIHLNPQDIKQDYKNYKFSSYFGIISNLKTNIVKEVIIEIFGDLENFIYTHNHPPKLDFSY